MKVAGWSFRPGSRGSEKPVGRRASARARASRGARARSTVAPRLPSLAWVASRRSRADRISSCRRTASRRKLRRWGNGVAGFALIVNPRSGDESPSVQELVREARRRGIDCHGAGRGRRSGRDRAGGREAGVLGGRATGRWCRSPPSPSSATCRSSAFPSERETTSRVTSRSTETRLWRPLESFDGSERRIDVGRVNGRLFLNNVSLGVYAGLVHRRERHRRRGEALAGLRAVASLIRGGHRPGPESAVAPCASSDSSDRQQLRAEPVHARGAPGARRREPPRLRGFWWLPETGWSSSGRLSHRARHPWHPRGRVDGEPLRLESPLDVRCFPKALRVLKARGGPQFACPLPPMVCG